MPNTPASFCPGYRWKTAANVVASVLALLAILLMVNYLAASRARRFQWTSDSRFTLSPVTTEVLRSITNNVKVIVFYDRTKPLYSLVSDLLREFQTVCPRLQVEYVDYERSLGRARAVQAQYGLASAADGDRVIFDNGGQHTIVYARNLSEYDYGALLKGQEVRRTGFKGEQLFTSALLSLMDPRPMKVYFVQGHREHDPTDEDDQIGYSRFARVLQESQIAVARLEPTSLLSQDVPSDCELLVIANPVTLFHPEELERIEKYLNLGGRLLILLSVDSLKETTGLERMLAAWGVDIGRNFVYEAPQGEAGDVRQLVVTHFGNHPVVNPLGRSRLLLIMPRSVGAGTQNPQSADAPKVTELATTTPNGMASQLNGRVERQGAVIPLMVAVEKGAVQGIAADRGAARIVVLGDSYFLANTGIRIDANRDFARNAVHWLLSRDVLVQGITARSVKEYRIAMTPAELTTVRWLFLAGFPGGVLFLGFLVWLRRKA